MNASMVKIITMLIFALHGVGHYMGLIAVFGIKMSKNVSTESWLLSGILSSKITNIICFIFYLFALLAYLGAALGIMDWFIRNHNWHVFAVWAAILSIIALVLFWNAFPFLFPNKIGALVINVFVLLSVWWIKWPAVLFTK